MALKQAKITQQPNEKRYHTINLLEAAVISGTEVRITPVDTYKLTTLSGEKFTYLEPVDTYIILDERPKVHLLQRYGWFKEDSEIIPIIAYIPTHLLYRHTNDDGTLVTERRYITDTEYIDEPKPTVENYLVLKGNEFTQLLNTGSSTHFELKELPIKRGTLINIKYDFLEHTKDVSTFYVTDVKVDTVSLNYIANLVPYKHDMSDTFKQPEVDETTRSSHSLFDPEKY